jgi:LAO/AO transport system kinase
MKSAVHIDDLRSADRRTLARAITLLESTREDHQQQADQLIQAAMPFSGKSIRIGLTGVPGVGKSSLIEMLGSIVIDQGYKVAVLAVDPTSTISGGSILGDKTRMPTLAINSNAFIRPTPAGSISGGVARRTRESIILCGAAGFDVVIVETVGVGQSETLVREMTDVFLLMLLPGAGDELQGIKRGIMELADMIVINKADGNMQPKAMLMAADIQQALRLIQPRQQNWQVPVICSSALEKKNIVEVWDVVQEFQALLTSDGRLELMRKEQAKNWLWIETRELLLSKLKNDKQVKELLATLQENVMGGEVPPTVAAKQLVSKFLG